MEIKGRDVIFTLVILILVILIGYIFQSQSGSNYFPLSTMNQSLNYNDFYKTFNPAWDKFCLNTKESGLVILMHINKQDDKFSISCEYGPMFNSVMSKKQQLWLNPNLTSQFPDTFTGCDEIYAQSLHNLIVMTSPLASRNKENNLVLPLEQSISSPESLRDYYAIILACNKTLRPSQYASVTFLYDTEKNRFYQ